ncbi:hypothetical protein [Parasitella parasitica]|uniref:non-specific serine/threonine protein kinase n=1 Tax=Parasitella parasitica TaxID=35722 RepID=A0A0B7NDB5_9FUNG|nr:hypothetical protein [Parasitella parasitica]
MGKVKLALNTETNEKVAVKIVPRKLVLNKSVPPTKKERDAEISREIRTIREASIMLLLDHPFIARLDEMVLVDNFYYLFMEYVDGGQLLDYIISHGKLKERQARQFSRQIASALDYCHRNSIVHRDLKVENILISRSGTIKVIDFGLSNVFSPRSHLSTFCGSLYFAAPELLDGRMYTGPEVDVWSFGVVIYVLVVGAVPFDDQNVAALHAKVKQGEVEYPGHLSGDCKSLLQRMLVTRRKQRASLSEVIVHPWLNKGYDAPVENYLPSRKPLQLPVDMAVVRGMRGFEFGTEQAIKSELEAIITSEEYQFSAQQLHLTSKRSYEEIPSPALPLLRQRSYSCVTNDPQTMPAAYHPLISIYYLVKERMEKEAISSSSNGQQPKRLSDYNTTDSIGVSYTAHGKAHLQQQTSQQEQNVVQQALNLAEVPPRASNDFGHGHRRKISDASAASSLFASTCASGSTSSSKSPSIFRRLSRRLSRQFQSDEANAPIANTRHSKSSRRDSADASLIAATRDAAAPIVTLNGSPVAVEHHPPPSSSYRAAGKPFNNLLKRATSITVKDLPSTHHGTEHETAAGHFDRRPSAYTTTVERGAKRHNYQTDAESCLLSLPSSVTAAPLGTGDSSLTVEQKEHVDRKQQKADDSVKSVYLKGLFSVATTSSKKASEIRREIIRILVKKNISYREKKDRFECYLSNTKRPPGYSNKMRDTSDDDDDDDDNDTSNLDGPPVAVRFDIYIVKIPLLWGMRGVRFRRVSGDPWKYKNTCSMILDSLNL